MELTPQPSKIHKWMEASCGTGAPESETDLLKPLLSWRIGPGRLRGASKAAPYSLSGALVLTRSPQRAGRHLGRGPGLPTRKGMLLLPCHYETKTELTGSTSDWEGANTQNAERSR
ncbi:hypothetical protein DPEC_G00339710 [Dallia pectoralis]|uniref:Uncharacterized protein n=1 Tax=Dallia pectoralis TaxID=75939 RepID=A0ACC2F545_DALPE|nr:hypothetical protein DPEC_G00339710 [Dallia pectoralis]